MWIRADDPTNYTLSSAGRSNPWGPLNNVADSGRLDFEPTGWAGRMPCFSTGGADNREIEGTVPVSTAELFIAVMHQETARGPSNGIWWPDGTNLLRCHFPWGDDNSYFWDIGGTRRTAAANAVGTRNQVGLLNSVTLSRMAIYLDGAVGESGAAGSTFSLSTFRLAGNHVGRFAEVIVLQTVPTDPIRQRIEGYLAHKWGTVDRLPASHPYRNVPPLTGG
jgi:hypothetical protein